MIAAKKITRILEAILLFVFAIFLIGAPYSKRFAKICFINAGFWWLLISILKHKRRFYREFIPHVHLNIFLFLFLSLASISTIFSLNPQHSQSVLFERYLPYFIFFWVGLGFITSESYSLKKLYFLIAAFIVSSIVLGGGGVWDYIRIHPERLFSVFGKGQKCLFSFLIVFLPLNFSLSCFARNKWVKAGSIIALVLLFFTLLWHNSRSAWVAVTVAVFFMSIVKNKKLIPFLLVVLVLGFFLLSPLGKAKFKTLANPFSRSTLDDRVELMASAIDIAKEHPFVGAGLGMFEYLYLPPEHCLAYKYYQDEYYVPDNCIRYIHYHAHSIYLEIASEMGFFGLFAFLGIFVLFFIKSFKALAALEGLEQSVFLGLVGVVVAGLAMSLASSVIMVGVQDSLLFWFLFGIANGLILRARKLKEVV
ncbi:MAG: O-antigen ligase family protein [Candidatus Omnitrophica bacterium]|nr:O-antigen ligase family protein [Candidatus Omnitrophota bacterium]